MRPLQKKNTTSSLRQKNWFIWLTFTLSLIGAGKASHDLYKEVTKRPKFKFDNDPVLTNHILSPRFEYSTILILGRLFNSGNKPLFIKNFELEYKKDDRYITFYPAKIPANSFEKIITEDSLNELNFILAADKDFSNLSRLEPSEVLYGYFWFVSPNIDTSLFNGNIHPRIICHDINGKEFYSEEIRFNTTLKRPISISNPRIDYMIKPFDTNKKPSF